MPDCQVPRQPCDKAYELERRIAVTETMFSVITEDLSEIRDLIDKISRKFETNGKKGIFDRLTSLEEFRRTVTVALVLVAPLLMKMAYDIIVWAIKVV